MGVEYLESVGTGPCETHDKDTIGHLVDSGQWYIIWKSRGGIMENGVPREVPRPKPEGRAATGVGIPKNSWYTDYFKDSVFLPSCCCENNI